MPDPTTRLRLMRITPGGDNNVWGQRQNENTLDLVDEAIAGVERINLTGSAGTLTLTSSNYVSDLSRNAALVFYGTPSVDVVVTVPSVEKVYVVSNTTAKTVTLTAGGLTAALAAGDRATVWCDGTDCGFGSVTAATVNGLIANAVLAPGTLPGQAGNAGKFLQTDGSVPQWAPVVIPDVGGGADATITTSATLSNTASVVQSVDMASNAQSVRLPDATTLSKGGRKFVVLNVGNRTAGVRDNAGALLTVVPAGAAAELHLRDNATAAGSWGVTGRGLEPALTLVDHTAPTTISGAVETAVRLTDTLSLHFGMTTTGFQALAVDNGAGAAGTWTAVEATGAIVSVNHAFRISDTQAIVFWYQNPNHKAAVLTVDPVTRAITVGTAASTTVFLSSATFSGRPVLAQLTPTLYVALFHVAAGTNVSAMAISVSGSTVTFGSFATLANPNAQQALACYRVSDATALALYIDDSGTAGSPYSIRAAVLTVSGTTITAGTSAGINDVAGAVAYGTVQLSATSYIVGYRNQTTLATQAVRVGVSGTTVSFGTPLTVEPNDTGNFLAYTDSNANRFQPNLFRVSDTAALMTLQTTGASQHVILTDSGGTLSAGAKLYSLWNTATGGNFPQTPAGFLAFSTTAAELAVFAVTVNGTALAVTGEFSDAAVSPLATAAARFGLSGGVCGIQHDSAARGNLFHLFKFAANGAPRYLGPLRLNDFTAGAFTPVEVAASKVAIISSAGATQPAATGNNVRLQIVEVAQ